METNKSIAAWLVSALVAIVLIGFGIWYYRMQTLTSNVAINNAVTNTPSAFLMKTNADFVRAQSLLKAGDYADAIASYNVALASATSTVSKGQILYKIAAATALNGDPAGAIKLYKKIAADGSNINILRAYAVSAMSELYYAALIPSLTTEIFKGDPYASFYIATSTALSYRRLNEYAISFYPLALPELRVAAWYAAHLARLGNISTSSPEVAADLAVINQGLQKANADIRRIRYDPNANGDIPNALMREAVILGQLSSVHLESADTAEAAYRNALAMYNSFGFAPGTDGYARYYYALFLTQTYGQSRANDVQTILKPLYTTAGYQKYPVQSFFKEARLHNGMIKKGLADMARLDPGFRTLLVSLGWTSSDF